MATSDLVSIIDYLQTIAANIVEIRANIAEIKDVVEMKVDIVEMKADIVEMKADIVENEADMSAMSGKLDKLSDNFDFFKGEANERLLRERVQKIYGEKFSRRFVVQGISGLVRLLIPPRKDSTLYHTRDVAKDSFQYSDQEAYRMSLVICSSN